MFHYWTSISMARRFTWVRILKYDSLIKIRWKRNDIVGNFTRNKAFSLSIISTRWKRLCPSTRLNVLKPSLSSLSLSLSLSYCYRSRLYWFLKLNFEIATVQLRLSYYRWPTVRPTFSLLVYASSISFRAMCVELIDDASSSMLFVIIHYITYCCTLNFPGIWSAFRNQPVGVKLSLSTAIKFSCSSDWKFRC